MKLRGTFGLVPSYLKISAGEFLAEVIVLTMALALLAYTLQFRPLTMIGWLCLISSALIMCRRRIKIQGVNVLGLEIALSTDQVTKNVDIELVAKREGIDPSTLRSALQAYGDQVPGYVLNNGDVYIKIHSQLIMLGKVEDTKTGAQDTKTGAKETKTGVQETRADAQAAAAEETNDDVRPEGINLSLLIAQDRLPPPLARVSSPTIHQPGETVIDSGIYNVVDRRGTYLNHQDACIEDKRFPALSDPRAHGYVLYRKTRHRHPPQKIFLPRQNVQYSGIYDVVDKDGVDQNHQYTFVAGTNFPFPHPPAHGYALAERVTYMSRIYLPGDSVSEAGTYDVVDLEGMPIGGQIGLPSGSTFPESTEPNAYGYMFH